MAKVYSKTPETSSQPTTDSTDSTTTLAIAKNEFNITPTIGFCPNGKGTNTAATPDEIPLINLFNIKTFGLSKVEINKLINLTPPETNFKGWLLKDEIKIDLEVGSYFIDINTGDKLNHCSALYATKTHFEYWDSMGETFKKDIGIPVKSNHVQYQTRGYNTCGLHAAYFIRQRLNFGSMEKVQESYPCDRVEFLYSNLASSRQRNLVFNEEHVHQYFSNILRSREYSIKKKFVEAPS